MFSASQMHCHGMPVASWVLLLFLSRSPWMACPVKYLHRTCRHWRWATASHNHRVGNRHAALRPWWHAFSRWAATGTQAWTPGCCAKLATHTHPSFPCLRRARQRTSSVATTSRRCGCDASRTSSWRAGGVPSKGSPPRQCRLHACPPRTSPTNPRGERESLLPRRLSSLARAWPCMIVRFGMDGSCCRVIRCFEPHLAYFMEHIWN